MRHPRLALRALAGLLVLAAACKPDDAGAPDLKAHSVDLAAPDLARPTGTDGGADLARTGNDLAGVISYADCGDAGTCTVANLGPPALSFPLQSDPDPQPNELDTGVARDDNGFVGLSTLASGFDFLWIANTDDWGVGTVSKLDARRVRETARYFSVTCLSNVVGGGQATCDGENGCCTRDDYPRWLNRAAGLPSGGRQQVQRVKNDPSRTAVDYNGDVWIANRAFGGQSSVTKIANSLADCEERNGAQGIQTSRDTNGDGVIDTDCNGNGVPDSISDVRTKPCTNGMAQEFYGWDDECVLFTTNTNIPDQYGRPIALGKGSVESGPSDAWVGTYKDGKFFRVDGQTGFIKAVGSVPGNPYGAIIDAKGILWAAKLEDDIGLSWLDTASLASGAVRTPAGTDVRSYGIAIDRDQNVWTGGWGTGQANRYTPDRAAGLTRLGAGYWTIITNPGQSYGVTGSGRGLAADSRSKSNYFVWLARETGFLVRIPASALPLPSGADTAFDGRTFPAVQVAGNQTTGVGIDPDQNVWGISREGNVATRVKVDAMGSPTKPDVVSGTPDKGCPVGKGDRCTLALTGRGTGDPHPYTYSDFTGFGLRNFTTPRGSYAWIQQGCSQGDTTWMKLVWNAQVPSMTTLGVRVRTGKTPIPDGTWTPWVDATTTPFDLRAKLPRQETYLQVEFNFATNDRSISPTLKSVAIWFACGIGIG